MAPTGAIAAVAMSIELVVLVGVLYVGNIESTDASGSALLLLPTTAADRPLDSAGAVAVLLLLVVLTDPSD